MASKVGNGYELGTPFRECPLSSRRCAIKDPLRFKLRKARYEHMVSARAPMRDMCPGDFGVGLERQDVTPHGRP